MSKYKMLMEADCLPKKPASIQPLNKKGANEALVIGGLSVLGDKGCICPVVTLVMRNNKRACGWSLCIGDPDQKKEEPYFFDTSKGTQRGTEIPNSITFFQKEVDSTLLAEDADKEAIDEIIAYVLLYISNDGPPPPCSEK